MYVREIRREMLDGRQVLSTPALNIVTLRMQSTMIEFIRKSEDFRRAD